jgi:hypothetical protein
MKKQAVQNLSRVGSKLLRATSSNNTIDVEKENSEKTYNLKNSFGI